jgi:hypothetical protein
VSVNPSSSFSSLFLNLFRQNSLSPVEQQGVEAPSSSAVGSTTPSARAPLSFADGFEQASASQQQWAAKFAADAQPQSLNSVADSSVIQQTKGTDCGAATAAMLAHSTGQVTDASDSNLMNYLDSRFASAQGTTPRQLSDMLAHEGMSVTRAETKVDPQALNEALGKGNKVAIMVDPDGLKSGAAGASDGKAHWVVVDGMDAQGQYKVKDSSTGSSYSVGLEQLSGAVDSAWGKHSGGGMLVVERAQAGQSESTVAETSAQNSVKLGNSPGGGSNALKTFGRESS